MTDEGSMAKVCIVVALIGGCEARRGQSDAPRETSLGQVGTDIIEAALATKGTCALQGPNVWTYAIDINERRHVTVETFFGLPDQVQVLLDDSSGMAQGLVNFPRQAIDWFDVREHTGEGRRSADGRVVQYAPETWAHAQAEWNSPRGQLLVRLAREAKAVCAAAPLSPVRPDSE